MPANEVLSNEELIAAREKHFKSIRAIDAELCTRLNDGDPIICNNRIYRCQEHPAKKEIIYCGRMITSHEDLGDEN